MDITPATAPDRQSPPPPAWHALSPESAMATLQADVARGLTAAEAAARLRSDGPNVLPAPQPAHPVADLPAPVPQPAGVRPAGRGSAFPRPRAPDGRRLHRLRARRERAARRLAGTAGGTAERRACRACCACGQRSCATPSRARSTQRNSCAATSSCSKAATACPPTCACANRRPWRWMRRMLTGESVPVAHDAALVCEAGAAVADRTNMRVCRHARRARPGERRGRRHRPGDRGWAHREQDDRHGGRQAAADGPHGAIQSCGGDRRPGSRGADRAASRSWSTTSRSSRCSRSASRSPCRPFPKDCRWP